MRAVRVMWAFAALLGGLVPCAAAARISDALHSEVALWDLGTDERRALDHMAVKGP
jgi:hypothetical protein